MWIHRDFEQLFKPNQGQPVSVIVGPRQSGKSSVLEKLASGSRKHVTLDDFTARDQARTNPRLFLDALGDELLIDEAQHAPELFSEIKLRVDRLKAEQRRNETSKPISYWLTGSNRILLDSQITETLTGRASFYRFHPLSLTELASSFHSVPFAKLLERGCWPELWANEELESLRYIDDYLQTTLEKDFVQAARIEKIDEFLRVARLLAGRVGGLFVASELGRDAGVRSSTVSEWVGLLNRMMFTIDVPPFLNSRSQRIIKAHKYFWVDVALAARLQGWSSATPILGSPAVGGLFESFVASEIVKTRDLHQKRWELTHFRTKEAEEIDFIVSDARHHVAIECKYSSTRAAAVRKPKSIQHDAIHRFFSVSFDSPPQSLTKNSETELCSVFELSNLLLNTLD